VFWVISVQFNIRNTLPKSRTFLLGHPVEQQIILEECGQCPVFARYTLAFALQMRENHGKTSFRVAEECQLAR